MSGDVQFCMAGTKGRAYSPPLSEEEIRDIKKALAETPEHRCTSSKEMVEWLNGID